MDLYVYMWYLCLNPTGGGGDILLLVGYIPN